MAITDRYSSGGGSLDLQVGVSLNQADFNKIKSEIRQLSQLTKEDLIQLKPTMNTAEIDKQLKEIQIASQAVENALTRAFNFKLGNTDLSRFREELNNFKIDSSNIAGVQGLYKIYSQAGSAGVKAFDNIASAVMTSNVQIRESNSLMNKLSTTFGNTVRYGISSSVFNRLADSLGNAWNFTKALDSSLNNIRIVTGKSADEMERFAKLANQSSSQLGARTTDFTNAALIYYQQGLGDAESQKRAEITLKAANVTGQSAAATSEQLTAIWNGYKVSAQEAELYIDKVAKVAAGTAADLEEMATGISKVASAASTAGVDIDQLNGMISTVVSVTREAPETIGTSFRTIFARLGDLKQGVTEDGVTLGKVSGQLAEMGVQILKDNGDMRDMGDIIEDLGAKWQTWTQAQKQAAAVALAGKMQYSRMMALFENWDQYNANMQMSKDALGELTTENNIYLDSLEAHINQLTTQWDRLVMTFTDSDSFKVAIDGFSGVLSVVTDLVQALGGGGGTLATFGSALTAFAGPSIANRMQQTFSVFKDRKSGQEYIQDQIATLTSMRDTIRDTLGEEPEGYTARIDMLQNYDASNKTSEQVKNDLAVINDYGKSVAALQGYEKDQTEQAKALSQELGITTEEFKKLFTSIDNPLKTNETLTDIKTGIEDITTAAEEAKNAIAEIYKIDEQRKQTSSQQDEAQKEARNKYIEEQIEKNNAEQKAKETLRVNKISELEGQKRNIKSGKDFEVQQFQENQKEEIDTLNTQIEQKRKNLEKLKKQSLSELTQQLEELEETRKSSQKSLNQSKGILKRANLSDEIKTKHEKNVAENEERLSNLNKEKEIIENQINATKQKSAKSIENTERKIQDLAQEIDDLEDQVQKRIEENTKKVKQFKQEQTDKINEEINQLRLEGKNDKINRTTSSDIRKKAGAEYDSKELQQSNELIEQQKQELVEIETLEKGINTLLTSQQKSQGVVLSLNQENKLELEQQQQKLTEIKEKISNGQQLSEEDLKTLTAINNKLEEIKNNYAEIETKTRNIAEDNINGKGAILKNEVNTNKKNANKIVDDSEISARYNKITATTGAVLALGAAVSSVTGLFKTWGDESVSIGGKIGQTFMSLASVAMTMTTSLASLSSAFGMSVKAMISSIGKAILALGPYALAIAAIVGVVGGAIYAAYQDAHRLENNLKSAQEAAEKANQAFQELGQTLSGYKSAVDGLSELTKGTVEWYEQIVKVNEEAEKLIDKWGLLLGKDYTIDSNGLISISEQALKDNYFEETQKNYRAQAQVYNAKRAISEDAIEKIEDEFNRKVTTKTKAIYSINSGNYPLQMNSAKDALNYDFYKDLKFATYKLSKDDTNAMLRGDKNRTLPSAAFNDSNFLKLINSQRTPAQQKIDPWNEKVSLPTGNNIIKPIDLTKDVESKLKKNITVNPINVDITKEVEEDRAKRNAEDAKNREISRRQADLTIRGYGSYGQIQDYENMSDELRLATQDYVAREQKRYRDSYKKEEPRANWFAKRNFVSDKEVKAMYAEKVLGYSLPDGQTVIGAEGKKQYDGYGSFGHKGFFNTEWQDKNGNKVKQNDIFKDIDTEQAYAWLENGGLVQDDILKNSIERIKKIREITNKAFKNEDKAEYVTEAMTSAMSGTTDYNYSVLSQDELDFTINSLKAIGIEEEVLQNIRNTTIDATARARSEHQKYLSALQTEAQALGTTSEALDLYSSDLKRVNKDVSENTKSTAKAAAQAYKTNKVYNEAADIYDKSKSNMEAYAKAIKNGTMASTDVYDSVGDLMIKLKEMFRVDYISPEVFKKQFTNIQKMLTGTAEEAAAAEKEIGRAFAIDNLANTIGESADAVTPFIDKLREIQSVAENTTIGQELSNQLIDWVNNAQLTAEQAEKIFANLHLKTPEVDDTTMKPNIAQIVTPMSSRKVRYSGEMPVLNGRVDAKGKADTVKVDYVVTETVEEQRIPYVKYKKGQDITTIGGLAGSSGNNNFSRTPPKSSKSGSSSKPSREKPLQKEKDAYHDVNIQLALTESKLKLIQSQNDKAFGIKKIENYNKQIEALNDKLDLTKQKLAIARQEQQRLGSLLAARGAAFNADGTIANYAQLYESQLAHVNEIINAYNGMSKEQQESYKETLDAAKEDFSKFEEQLKDYDDNVQSIVPGLISDIQAIADEKIEIEIEKFNMEIEIRLDMAEAERDWNQFKKKVLDEIKDADIFGNAKARLQDFFSYYKENQEGIIQTNTRHVEDILTQLRQMDNTGWSDVYGDNRTKALEDLKTYYEQLMSDMEDIIDLQNDMHDSYLNMIDEAKNKFDDQVSMFEQVNDLIDHDVKLLQLLNGDKVFVNLDKYYDKAQKNYQQQLDFQRGQVAIWAEMMNRIADKTSDEWLKARDNWIAATNDLNSTLEGAIDNAKEKWENAIDATIDKLTNALTNGLGMDYVEEQWKLANENADRYLDTINRTYETQKLADKYQEAINKSDNPAAQEKLRNLMKEQVDLLEKKERVTKYDIERANKLYEIHLKELALEEAQQNKSTMRLRRDSQGNYRYEFVQNEDNVHGLQDELDDLRNSLYNFDKDHFKEIREQSISDFKDYIDRRKEIMQEYANDQNKMEEMLNLVNNEYNELSRQDYDDLMTAKTNLTDSAMADMSELFGISMEDFDAMTDDEVDNLMKELVPTWDVALQSMLEAFCGPDGFTPVVQEAITELDNTTLQYEEDLKGLENSADISFDGITNGVDRVIDETNDLIAGNDELLNQYGEAIQSVEALMGELSGLIAKYKAAEAAAKAAVTAAKEYWMVEQESAAKAAEREAAANGLTNSNGGSGSSGGFGVGENGSSGSGGGPGNGGGNYSVKSGDTLSALAERFGGSAARWTEIYSQNQSIIDETAKARGLSAGGHWIFPGEQLYIPFETGGYTGNWAGKEGRVGILHKKEMVLNAKDTENMLNAVGIIRSITDSVGTSMLARINALGSSVQAPMSNTAADTLEQNVHIDATFPGVEDAAEIKEALENLINIASQRANRKRI